MSCSCDNDETTMCVPCGRTYMCRECIVKCVRKYDLCSECRKKESDDVSLVSR